MREGERKGESSGERSGRVKVQAQLAQRFGPLDQGNLRLLATARVRDLDRWATRILTAGSLEEMFAEE